MTSGPKQAFIIARAAFGASRRLHRSWHRGPALLDMVLAKAMPASIVAEAIVHPPVHDGQTRGSCDILPRLASIQSGARSWNHNSRSRLALAARQIRERADCLIGRVRAYLPFTR